MKLDLRWLLFALVGVGCTSPAHLNYDHGRAFAAAFSTQADLTRQDAARPYNLYGIEAIEIRLRVRDETTNAETGDAALQ